MNMRIHRDNSTDHFSVASAQVHQRVHIFEAIVSRKDLAHIHLCEGDHRCVEDVVNLRVLCCIRPKILAISISVLEIIADIEHTLVNMVTGWPQSGVCLRD